MKLQHIELKPGELHPLCFSLSATEEIIDAFGSLESMQDAVISGDTMRKIKAIDTVLSILLRAGRRYCKEMGVEMPPEIRCRPGDLIDVTDPKAITAIFETIRADSEREIEATPKNE